MTPEYEVVVATRNRAGRLANLLATVAAQTVRPRRVHIVDASDNDATRELAASQTSLEILYARVPTPSSARQRNLAVEKLGAPLALVVDDDVEMPPDTLARLAAAFGSAELAPVGGVSARISDFDHFSPGALTRLYYRVQAGYPHPNYGAKLFGPAINCLPCYAAETAPWIPGQWLPSTCVLYRSDLLQVHRFPAFEGYSILEDVHLSARIAATHRLYFARDILVQHHYSVSGIKQDIRQLRRMALRNHRAVALEVMRLPPTELRLRLFLHRLFLTASAVRRRHRIVDELAGIWSS